MTSGNLGHGISSWMPGGAVAEIAFTGASHEAWIESQQVGGPGHRKLSATVLTLDPSSLAFSTASGLTALVASPLTCCANRTETLETVGAPGSRPKVLDSWPDRGAGSLSAAWSPNGRLIAYTPVRLRRYIQTRSWWSGAVPLAVIAAGGQRGRVLTSGLTIDSAPLFSPDSRSILFCAVGRRGGLYTVTARGGPVHQVTHEPCDHDLLAWSPNGRQIAYLTSGYGSQPPSYLYVTNVRTGRISTLAGPVHDYGALAWSPDGKKIAFEMDSATSATVETTNLDDTGIHGVAQIRGNSAIYGLAWSPDSRQIAFTAGPGPMGY